MPTTLNSLNRRHVLHAAAATAGFALTPTWAQQTYPNKVVKIVAPYAAGGSLDIVARLLAQKLSVALGQQFVVENKPGASGNIGTESVVRSAADGYTLAILPDSNLTANAHLFPGMSFNPQKDLAPIGMLTNIGIALVANPTVPAKTLTELLSYAKTLPGGLSYGSPGNGTPHHLAGELLEQATGANLVHVAYRGGAPATQAVLGGEIPCAFVALAVAGQHIKSGKLRLIGVTHASRSSLFPDAPTLGETVKGFDATSWIGLFAPAGTPADVIQKLNLEMRKALSEPATAQMLAAQSLDPMVGTSNELRDRIQAESQRLGALIKAKGIKLK